MEPGEDEDIIRVAAATDILRLSGLITSRWSQMELGFLRGSGVFLQAMGPRSIDKMVRALAMSWQKSARRYEGDVSEVGFACLPMHIPLPPADRGAAGGSSHKRFSGVQCVLVPPAEFDSEWQ